MTPFRSKHLAKHALYTVTIRESRLGDASHAFVQKRCGSSQELASGFHHSSRCVQDSQDTSRRARYPRGRPRALALSNFISLFNFPGPRYPQKMNQKRGTPYRVCTHIVRFSPSTVPHTHTARSCARLSGYLPHYEGAGLSGVKSVKEPGRMVTVSGVAPMISPSTMRRAGFSVSSVSVRTCAIVSSAEAGIATVSSAIVSIARTCPRLHAGSCTCLPPPLTIPSIFAASRMERTAVLVYTMSSLPGCTGLGLGLVRVRVGVGLRVG